VSRFAVGLPSSSEGCVDGSDTVAAPALMAFIDITEIRFVALMRCA
jgi:hypothetical protein